MFKLFIIIFTVLQVSVLPSSLITHPASLGITVSPSVPQSQAIPDAKLILIGNSYAVAFSNKLLMTIRLEDVTKFLGWMKTSENSTPPPYSIESTDNVQYPYKIVALFTGEEFLLKKPAPPNIWKLSLGEWGLYTLSENLGVIFGLQPENFNPSSVTYWELENTTNEPVAHEWRPGDTIVIVDVMAHSSNGQIVKVGHLIFRFENKAEALQWISAHSESGTGFWATKVQ